MIRYLFLLFSVQMAAQSPCPAYVVAYDGETVAYCGQQSQAWSSPIPCGVGTNYMAVQFTVNESPYPIHLWSGSNYINFPNSPINYPDIGIMDACGGQLIYYTGAFACGVGSQIAPPPPSTQEFTLMLNLSPGTYIAIIGYWIATGSPYQSQGCIEYTFGPISFLSLPTDQEQQQTITKEETPKRPPVYVKIMRPGDQSPVILNTQTGKIIDLTCRIIE